MFKDFISKISTIKSQADILEKLGDIPEDFICPISQDLMKDPVKLPTSNTIVDRAIIKEHLLNNEIDPFSRAPLSYKDLIEQPELKRRIEEWIRLKLWGEKKSSLKNTHVPEQQTMDEEDGPLYESESFHDPVLNKLR